MARLLGAGWHQGTYKPQQHRPNPAPATAFAESGRSWGGGPTGVWGCPITRGCLQAKSNLRISPGLPLMPCRWIFPLGNGAAIPKAVPGQSGGTGSHKPPSPGEGAGGQQPPRSGAAGEHAGSGARVSLLAGVAALPAQSRVPKPLVWKAPLEELSHSGFLQHTLLKSKAS